MITLTEKGVKRALSKIESGLADYRWIQHKLGNCDVSKDPEFQKRFNAFYMVRRPADWRRYYYGLMQKAKSSGTTFADVLRKLKKYRRIEASFASKLVATLDPNEPVIDRRVFQALGLRLPRWGESNREDKATELYDRLRCEFDCIRRSPLLPMIRNEFRHMYPSAEITDTKKIDFVLWKYET